MKKMIFLLLIVIVGAFALPLLTNDAILLYYGDAIEIVYPYFLHFHQQIQNGTLSFWNHSMGLGTNNIANLINALGSPFLYLSLIFPLDFLKHYFLLADAVRFFLTGIFAYLWFSKLFEKDMTRISLALIFAFSGWALNFVIFTFYLDAYMYLPLMLYLSEEVLDGKKQLLFSLVIALICFYSLYFLYMFSMFLFIYHLYRYFTLENRSLKVFTDRFFALFKYYLLGLLLIGFVLLPSIQVFLSTPRIEGNIIEGLRFDLNPLRVYNFISSFFSPVMSDYNTNLFISRDVPNYGSVFYVFTSVLTVLAVLNLILVQFKVKKIYFVFLIGLLVLSFIPAANVLMNGNQHIRWHFMIMIFILLGLGYFLENNQKPKVVALFAVFQLVSLLSIAFISYQRNFVHFEYVEFYGLLVGLLIIMILAYGFGYSIWKKHPYILFALIVIELITLTNIRMHLRLEPRYMSQISFKDFDINRYHNLFEQIKSDDYESYYRIDVQNAMGNDPLLQNYRGFTFYSSLYNHATRSLLNGRFADNWNVGYRSSKFVFKHFLGNKYVVSDRGVDLLDFGYQLDFSTQEKDVYVSSEPTRLAYVLYETVDASKWDKLDKSIQDFWMYSHVSIPGGNKTSSSPYEPALVKAGLADDYVDFTTVREGYWIIDYSRSNANAQCQIDYYRNGNLDNIQNLSEYGYVYINDEDNFDGAYVYCRSLYNSNEIVPSNIYYVPNDLLSQMYSDLSRYETFDWYHVDGDRIEAEITIEKEGANVIMSMAYDSGWSVTANDEIVETFKVDDGLLAFKLSPGTYAIKMNYLPPYFRSGVILSLIGLVISILHILKTRKTKHEKR